MGSSPTNGKVEDLSQYDPVYGMGHKTPTLTLTFGHINQVGLVRYFNSMYLFCLFGVICRFQHCTGQFIYLFGVLRRFQHCSGHHDG